MADIDCAPVGFGCYAWRNRGVTAVTGQQAGLEPGPSQNHAGHVRRPGYATEHPELVAAMVQSFAIRDLADAVRQAGTEIESGARAIANAIPEP